MARTLLRLKLRLLRNGLRVTGRRGTFNLVLAMLVAGFLGVIGALAFAATRTATDSQATDATVIAFAVIFLVWVLGPLLTASAGELLAPENLVLFPLRPNQLMPGLLAAALVGAGGLTTILVLVGAVAGMAPASPALVVTVAAAIVELGMCVAVSRLVAAAISGAAQTRRWRDIVVFAAPLIGLAINLSFQFTAGSAGRGTSPSVPHALISVTRLSPSTLPALAMADARTGHGLRALVELTGGALVVAATLWLWWRVLDRILTMAPHNTAPAAGHRTALMPRLLGFLPLSRATAVLAKELRVSWRDPRQRAALLGTLFPGLIIFVRTATDRPSPALVLSLGAVAAFTGSAAGNLYGFDGYRHWFNVAAGDDARADLLGKSAARVVLTVPLLVLFGGLLAARSGGWSLLPAAYGLAVGSLLLMVGMSAVTSISSPYPYPERRSNMYSRGESGRGLRLFGETLGKLLVNGIIIGPLSALAYSMRDHPVQATAVGLAAVAVGLVAWRVCLDTAAGRSQGHQAELLEALSPRRVA
jgi:ABC-2 type transport system permease protein